MPLKALAGSYDYRLVVLSVLIAILASSAALDLGGGVAAWRGRVVALLVLGGAGAVEFGYGRNS
jgi:NO-binding membrane sensor protein with MHYT domain